MHNSGFNYDTLTCVCKILYSYSPEAFFSFPFPLPMILFLFTTNFLLLCHGLCVCGIPIGFIRDAYRNVSERLSYIVGALLMAPALKSAFPLFLPFSATIKGVSASGRDKAL